MAPRSRTASSLALETAFRRAFAVLKAALAVCVAGLVLSGVFIVHQNENAVVLRFGKLSGRPGAQVLKPGLHWAYPYPVDEVIRIPARAAMTRRVVDFWYAASDQEKLDAKTAPPQVLRSGIDGYMITADGNLIHSGWQISYSVTDTVAYLFEWESIEATLVNVFDNAVTRTAGDTPVDALMRSDREAFRAVVLKRTADALQSIGLPVSIDGLDLLQLAAPQQVVDSFNRVLEAEQEKNQAMSSAEAYAARSKEEAKGKEAAVLAAAGAYRVEYLETLAAERDFFISIRKLYAENPLYAMRPLYLRTIREALAQAGSKFVLRTSPDRDIRLMFNKPPYAPKETTDGTN